MLKTTACVLALLASVPATAGDPLVEQKETVRFDDLNLAHPAGIAKLERRLEGAARRVCGYNSARHFSRILPPDVSNCMDNALAGARQQVAAKTGTVIRKG